MTSILLTLSKVLVQVQFEPSAAEAKHLGSLREQTHMVQPILARGVHQQESAHLSCLALWKQTQSVRQVKAMQC